MKKKIGFLIALAVIVSIGMSTKPIDSFAQYSVVNYREQGGARWVIGGSLDVISGGDLDMETGSAFKVGGTEIVLPTTSSAFVISTLLTNAPDVANSVWGVSGGIRFEGSGASTAETTITATNPATVDQSPNLPDASGTVLLTGNITVSDSANQACTTTCAATCIIGMDNAGPAFVGCADAAADSCLCLTAD